jgi:acetyltransferase-like isoleucine patch superfamily enzyme
LEINYDLNEVPITTRPPIAKRFSIIYIFLIFISLFPTLYLLFTFYGNVLKNTVLNIIIIRLPIDILVWHLCFLITALGVGKFLLIILELIHKPREGIFKIDLKNKDYFYFCFRVTIKKFIFYVWVSFPIPWISNLAFKICGLKADFKSTLFDGWLDTEFVEFGKNIMVGQGALILSSIIIGDYMLLKKVIIGDHCIIGGYAVVSPGTVMEKGSVLGVWAMTTIGQRVEKDWTYIGYPAQKFKNNAEMRQVNIQRVRRIVDTGERVEFEGSIE